MKKITILISIIILTQLVKAQVVTDFSTGYKSLRGISINSNNEVFVSEHDSGKIYKLDSNGNKSEFASTGGWYANDITFDSNDNLFIAEPFMSKIFKVNTSGTVSTYIDIAYAPNGLVYNNDLLYYSTNNEVDHIDADLTVVNHSSGYYYAEDLAFDSAGNLYIADRQVAKLYKVTPAGVKTVIASDMYNILGVAVASNDVVYFTMHTPVADKILKYDPTTDTVSDYVTSGLDDPGFIAIDKLGNMYVTNWGSEKVVKIHDDFLLGVNDEEFNVFNIFPNPVDDQLIIASNLQLEKVEIFSVLGKKVKEFTNKFNNIELSNLSKGMYLVRIYSERGVATKKMIKK